MYREGDEKAVQTKEQRAKENALLAAIVDTEKELGPAIKSVFEEKLQDSFRQRLQDYIKEKDEEIEEICNWKPQEFIDSVEQLLKVRENARELKHLLVEMNEDVQSTGSTALEMSKEHLDLRLARRNITTTIDVLHRCSFVLELAGKINECLENRQFYAALRVLEQLKNIHLGRVAGFRFADRMWEHVPALEERIKAAVVDDFTRWLETMLSASARIGEIAIEQVHERLTSEHDLKEEQRAINARRRKAAKQAGDSDSDDGASSTSTSAKGGSGKGGREGGREGEGESGRGGRGGSGGVSGSDGVGGGSGTGSTNRGSSGGGGGGGVVLADARELAEVNALEKAGVVFTPVYQAYYIFSKLDALDEFATIYKDNRRLQSRVVLSPWNVSGAADPTTASEEEIAGYKHFFFQIAGFFIVEDTVMRTTEHLISRGEVDTLWEAALSKIQAVLLQQLTFCGSTTSLLRIKEFLLLFTRGMSDVGFRVAELSGFVRDMATKYADLLASECRAEITRSLDEDRWDSYELTSVADYLSLSADYAYVPPGTEPGGLPAFPVRVPFSPCVPRICGVVKSYITRFFLFAAGVPDMDEFIRRYTDELLIHDVNNRLGAILDSAASKLSIFQVVQISVNLAHFRLACSQFEDHFAAHRRNNARVSLTAAAPLAETAAKAEALVFQLVDGKIDEFLTLAVYDWTTSRAAVYPSEYVSELVAYLCTVFECLRGLPGPVRQAIHFTACKHVAARWTDMLSGDDVKKFTLAAIQSFDLDLTALEDFASDSGIQGLSDCFVELRQIVDLIMSDDITEVLDSFIRQTKYSQLVPSITAAILEKYKEESGGIFNRRKSARMTQIETVIPSLRSAAK